MRLGTKMLMLYGAIAVVLGVVFGRYLYSYSYRSATGQAAPAGSAGGSTEMGDSGVIAEQAYRQCGQLALDPKEKCYERILLTLVGQDQVHLAMGSLLLIGARDVDVSHFSHQYAHAIGIAAYSPDKEVGTVFRKCTEVYQSGCYHGVIQAYFMSLPQVETKDVEALCTDFTQSGADQWLRFQCVHGMGHGLTMVYDHDLPRALKGCDLLNKSWDRESCYGGAFMENVVGTTMPHHHAMAAGTQHAEQMAEHDHEGMQMDMPMAPKFKPRDPKDPYYPCSIVEAKHLEACYGMQTSIMLEMNGRNFGATAKTCDGAPPALRYTCYQSLGTNISGETTGDNGRALQLCSLGNPRYQPWCILGVVKNRIDVTAQAADGFAFCREVPSEPNRKKCYQAVGEEVAVLKNADSDREKLCAQSEPAFTEECRFGARLTNKAPAGLPLKNGET